MGRRKLARRPSDGELRPDEPSLPPASALQQLLRAICFLDFSVLTILYVLSDDDGSAYSASSSTPDMLALSLIRSSLLLPPFFARPKNVSVGSFVYVLVICAVNGALLSLKLYLTRTSTAEGDGLNRIGDVMLMYSIAIVVAEGLVFSLHALMVNHSSNKKKSQTGPGPDSEKEPLLNGNGTRSDDIESGALVDEKQQQPLPDAGSTLRRLMTLLKPDLWAQGVGCIFLLISSLSSLAIPMFVGRVTDIISRSSSFEEGRAALLRTLLALVLFGVMGGMADFCRTWFFFLASERFVQRLRKLVYSSIIQQEIAFFDTTRTGELVNRLSGDCSSVQGTITTNFAFGLRSLAQVVGGLCLLVHISWRLTLVMLAVTPAVSIGAVIYGKFMRRVGGKLTDLNAQCTVAAEEAISNIRVVKSFSREEYEQERYDLKIDDTYRQAMNVALGWAIYDGCMTVLCMSSIALVLWFGSNLVLRGRLTPGQLSSYIPYTIFTGLAFAGLSRVYGDLMKIAGTAKRIIKLIDRKPLINVKGGKKPPPFEGRVILEHVSFNYPSRPEVPVLKDVSLTLEPGKVVALVGSSGGGKSTIAKLIERFYDVDQGCLFVGAFNVKTIDPIWLHHQIGLVSQEPVLFATSIENNIRYAVHREVSQLEIERAAKLANAHKFIMSFPEGYQTVVGERGIRLSGGQKQRIVIARALLMDPRILLLDEATSALDAESEHLVKQAIDNLMVGRSVLVIAHRLSTVRNAHKVCVVSDGRIVEAGTHAELLARMGIYRKLVERQLQ